MAQEACNAADNTVAFHIESNLPYTGDTYVSASAGARTFRLPSCIGREMPPPPALRMHSARPQPALRGSGRTPPTNDDSFTNSYALRVNYANTPGDVNMTVTYSVSQ